MNCPRCSTQPLETRTMQGVEVDQCPACRGIWFDKRELYALTDTFEKGDEFAAACGAIGLPPKSTAAAPGPCPRDGTPMRAFDAPCAGDAPRTVIDICPRCIGIWVDGNELLDLHSICCINRETDFVMRFEIQPLLDPRQKFYRFMVPRFVRRALKKWRGEIE